MTTGIILSPEDIRRREEALKQSMLQTQEDASQQKIREIAALAPSPEALTPEALSTAGAAAEQAGRAAQREQFPGRGVTTREIDPVTGEPEAVRTGATPEVTLPATGTVSPEQAVSTLRGFNETTGGTQQTPESVAATNRAKLSTIAGGFIKPPTEFKGDKRKLNAKMERLLAFEREQNLRPGDVGVVTVPEDVSGRAGRRRAKGSQPTVVLSPVEIEDVMTRINTLIDNPKTGSPITEEEFQGVKMSLTGTKAGNDFLRERRNEELSVDSDIETNVPLLNNSEDVAEFLTKYQDNNIISSYAETQLAAAISDTATQNKIRLGNKELTKEKKIAAIRSQEVMSNVSRFKKFLLKEKGYNEGAEVNEIISKVRSGGDDTSLLIYNEFKSSEDHVQINDEDGQVKFVEVTTSAKKKQREDRQIKESIIAKNPDTKNAKVVTTLKDNGAQQVDIDVVNESEELKEKYKPPADLTVAAIPQNVSTRQLSNQARQLVISDGISVESAINAVTDNIEGADAAGIKMIKSGIANDLAQISRENLNLVSESLTLDREESVQELRVQINQFIRDWPSENATNPAFADIIAENGIKGYLLGQSLPGKPNYRPGALGPMDEEAYEYVERGLSLAEAGSADAVNFGPVKGAFDIVRNAAAVSELQAQEVAKQQQLEEANNLSIRNEITDRNLASGLITFWEQNPDGTWSNQAFVKDQEGYDAYKIYQAASDEQRKDIVARETKRRQDKAQLVAKADGDLTRLGNGDVRIVQYNAVPGSDKAVQTETFQKPESEQDWDSYAQYLKNTYGKDAETFGVVMDGFREAKAQWNETVVKEFLRNENIKNLSEEDIDSVTRFINEATEEWSLSLAQAPFQRDRGVNKALRETFKEFGQARKGAIPKQQLIADVDFTADAPPTPEQFNVPEGHTLMFEKNDDGTLNIVPIRDDLVQRAEDGGAKRL